MCLPLTVLLAVPPTVLVAGLVSGALALTLAPWAKYFGTRRFAMAGSVLFPAGIYVLPAWAIELNSWSAFACSSSIVGGFGFYCVYPQIPPLLSARWFPDRKGFAVSVFFTSFGAGLLVATPLIERLLGCFRVAPQHVGGLDGAMLSSITTGPRGERLLELDGVQRVRASCIVVPFVSLIFRELNVSATAGRWR